MIGPGNGIALAIPTLPFDTYLMLTCGQVSSDADNHASAATNPNDAFRHDRATRSITPDPPRQKPRSADACVFDNAPSLMSIGAANRTSTLLIEVHIP
jgi:hypothetical protein